MVDNERSGLASSASSGDRLATLRALRDLLAREIESCESMRDLAALAGRLQSTLAEITVLEPRKAEGDVVDELQKRRDTRRSRPAADSSRAKRSSQ